MIEKASFDFRLGKIDETRNYILNEISLNSLMRLKKIRRRVST